MLRFYTLYNNHFCLLWKSEGVSFNQAIKELKGNFKTVVNHITKENVNSHFEDIYKPKKFESHLTNFIVYVLETHNTDRARRYVFCFYRLSKLAGRYNRDLTRDEIDKCKKKILLLLMEIFALKSFRILFEIKRRGIQR